MRIFEHNFVAGKYFSRRMQQNLPKRHLYTLVKTGSYISMCFSQCTSHPSTERYSSIYCSAEVFQL